MKPGLATLSLLLLGMSVLFLVALTIFESAMTGMAPGTERIVTALLLVLPAGLGAVLGALSLVRGEGRTGLAMAGTILNALFALFHLLVVLFAG